MTRRQIAKGFVSELQQKSFKEAVNELAALLITERQTKDLNLLLEEVRAELQRAAGHVSAEVITARPLGSELRKAIIQLVQQKTKAKSIDVSNKIDESIKGGFIARTADMEIDASVSGKLSQLKGATR